MRRFISRLHSRSFLPLITTATVPQCQEPTVPRPALLGDRTSLSLFMLCCLCFSQFSAHTCQRKSAYINKEEGGGGQGEEVIFAVRSQGQRQSAGLRSVQTHHPQFSMLLSNKRKQLRTLLMLQPRGKRKHMGKHFTGGPQTFLLFLPFNLPLYHRPKLLLLLQSVVPRKKKKKTTIKYHLVFLGPRLLLGKRTSALKYHMSQIKLPVTRPSDTQQRSCPIAHLAALTLWRQTS